MRPFRVSCFMSFLCSQNADRIYPKERTTMKTSLVILTRSRAIYLR